LCQNRRGPRYAVLLAHAEGGEDHLTAPMAGKVIAVLAGSGNAVGRGTPLIVIETSKMQHHRCAGGGYGAGSANAVGDQVCGWAKLLILGM
jgi:acetyl/propionyl-CoA carboxylase alpha subunit